MTTGNLAYLLMALGMFTAFAAVLACYSWQQARLAQPQVTKSTPAAHPPATQAQHPHDARAA